MKKLLAIILTAVCLTGFVFADEAADLLKAPPSNTTVTYKPEDIHPELHPLGGDKVSFEMDYTPSTEELRFYYICPSRSFDEGEARNTVLACMEDFLKKFEFHHYSYMTQNSLHYFKSEQRVTMARYQGHVKLYRY